jgi:hypothetical protein
VRFGQLAVVPVGELHRRVVMPATMVLLLWIVGPTLLFAMPSTVSLLPEAPPPRALAVVARLAHLITLGMVLVGWMAVHWLRWLDALAQSIRDDRYLVRRRLRNVDEVAPPPAVVH